MWITSKTLFEDFFNRKRIPPDTTKNFDRLSLERVYYLCQILDKWQQIPQYKISSKYFQRKPICSWWKGRTDITKLLISFSTCFHTVPNTSNLSCADYEVISVGGIVRYFHSFNPGTRRKWLLSFAASRFASGETASLPVKQHAWWDNRSSLDTTESIKILYPCR